MLVMPSGVVGIVVSKESTTPQGAKPAASGMIGGAETGLLAPPFFLPIKSDMLDCLSTIGAFSLAPPCLLAVEPPPNLEEDLLQSRPPPTEFRSALRERDLLERLATAWTALPPAVLERPEMPSPPTEPCMRTGCCGIWIPILSNGRNKSISSRWRVSCARKHHVVECGEMAKVAREDISRVSTSVFIPLCFEDAGWQAYRFDGLSREKVRPCDARCACQLSESPKQIQKIGSKGWSLLTFGKPP